MTRDGLLLRPRPRSLRSGAFFLKYAALPGMAMLLSLGVLGGPGALAAQEPDTVPRPTPVTDSIRPAPRVEEELRRGTRPDTVPADTTLADSLLPPPTLPAFPSMGPARRAAGVWEWNREALERLPDLSLLHLLERIPGVVPVRSDIVNQAEGAAIFGATAGAVRWVVDGYELDPLVGASYDPSRLPLLALSRVRVERRVTGATVHVETLSPADPDPRSIIEAATGDFSTELFRGMFLAPRVLGGPLSLGFERLSSNGATPGGSNHTAGWLKWSWVRDSSGLQVEYRQSGLERSTFEDELTGLRRDWVVRARTARGSWTGEVYAGASRVEDEWGDVVLREGTPQAGARVGGQLETPVPIQARAGVRLRDHPRLPKSDVEVAVRAEPFPFLAVDGEATARQWDAGPNTGRWTLRALGGPLLGLTAFSEVTSGGPIVGDGLTLRVPAPGTGSLRLDRSGLRAGLELRAGGLWLSGAWLRTELDTTTVIGLPTEFAAPRLPGGTADGVEVMARLPTGVDPVSLEGWYVGLDAPEAWLYTPRHHWRAGLVYHHLPLPSGNVEFFLRLEHRFRGRMTVPAGPSEEEGEQTVPDPGGVAALTDEVGAYRVSNLELSIRVLTVRAFLRWENIMNRRAQQDLPQFTHPGQHILYGVKWQFTN